MLTSRAHSTLLIVNTCGSYSRASEFRTSGSINIKRAFHNNSHSQIRADGLLSDPLRVSQVSARVVLQPLTCSTLPSTFGFSASLIDVSYHGFLTNLCYADDVVILVELVDTVIHALNIINTESLPLGLQVNWAKTKLQDLGNSNLQDPAEKKHQQQQHR